MKVKVVLEQNSNQMAAYHENKLVYQGNHTPGILELMKGMNTAYFKANMISNNLFLENLIEE